MLQHIGIFKHRLIQSDTNRNNAITKLAGKRMKKNSTFLDFFYGSKLILIINTVLHNCILL